MPSKIATLQAVGLLVNETMEIVDDSLHIPTPVTPVSDVYV